LLRLVAPVRPPVDTPLKFSTPAFSAPPIYVSTSPCNDCFRSLVVSLVHSNDSIGSSTWLDYGNFILSEFLPIFSDAFRPYLTLQLVWCFDFIAIRPRDRRPRDTQLAATSGTGQLQTGTHGIPSTARYGTRVLESSRSGIRPTKSPPPAVVVYTSAARPAVPSDNHRPSLVSCCSLHRLEFLACPPPSLQYLSQYFCNDYRQCELAVRLRPIVQ